MAKSLQDYLGQKAVVQNNNLVINIDDLTEMLGLPNYKKPSQLQGNQLAALLVVALFKGAEPSLNERGTPEVDNTQAVVSNIASKTRRLTTRDGDEQVEHRFTFDIYTRDNTNFQVGTVVGYDQGESSGDEAG